jgi:hypothetical protein
MKKLIITSLFALIGVKALPQVCASISAGPDKCASPCTTLTATLTGANSTTSYAVSTIPYSLQSLDGTLINNHLDDIWSPVINLGFPFCFYGTTYNQICVGANGMITFDLSKAGTVNEWKIWDKLNNDNFGNVPNNTICAVWRDIDPSISGSTYIKTVGTAPCRSIVISWVSTPLYSMSACTPAPSPQTFQLILYENSNLIDVNIQRSTACTNWNSGYGIVGLYKNLGTSLVAPGRDYPTAWSITNESWRFSANGTTPTITWTGPSGVIGTGASINVCPTAGTIYTASASFTNCNGTVVNLSDWTYVNKTPNPNTIFTITPYQDYYTVSMAPVETPDNNWDFNYCYRIEGYDAGYATRQFKFPWCKNDAAWNVWNNYPSTETFKGFNHAAVNYVGDQASPPPASANAGRFKYNYNYRIFRSTANNMCGWREELTQFNRAPGSRFDYGKSIQISAQELNELNNEVTTGINDMNLPADLFTVFPNPSNGIFTINLTNENRATMEVVDMTGRVIKTVQLNKNEHYTLDLSDFAKGQYMIKMNGEQQQLQKIVLE